MNPPPNHTTNLLLFLILGALVAIAIILNEGLVVSRELAVKPTEVHLEVKADSTLKEEVEAIKEAIGWGPGGLNESLAAPRGKGDSK